MLESKDLNKIARALFAMEQKVKKPDIAQNLHNEHFQRTFTDEYPFARKPRAREPIPLELREHWAEMDRRWFK